MYDLQVSGKAIRPKLISAHYFFNESQRLLGQLFSIDSPFWDVYYQHIEEHYKELELSEQTEELTEEHYHRLLQCKYSLTYVPLDALHFLTNKKNSIIYNQLTQAMQWFIIGYNLPNEVDGLGDDMTHGINNYAYWRLVKALQELNIPVSDDAKKMQQLLYATRVAETLHDEAITYLERARSYIQAFSLPYFKIMIDKRLHLTLKRKLAIIEYIEHALNN